LSENIPLDLGAFTEVRRIVKLEMNLEPTSKHQSFAFFNALMTCDAVVPYVTHQWKTGCILTFQEWHNISLLLLLAPKEGVIRIMCKKTDRPLRRVMPLELVLHAIQKVTCQWTSLSGLSTSGFDSTVCLACSICKIPVLGIATARKNYLQKVVSFQCGQRHKNEVQHHLEDDIILRDLSKFIERKDLHYIIKSNSRSDTSSSGAFDIFRGKWNLLTVAVKKHTVVSNFPEIDLAWYFFWIFF
jgi:hypothetical protein